MRSVGTMEKMFKEYSGVAEFRLIYIREAHALDSNRPNRTSRELGIKEHKTYEERCVTAEKMSEDRTLTMPMLIDDMDNSTDAAYLAKPDRVFLVRSDGRLAVAADRGPRGFEPALEDCQKWLKAFAAEKKEPELSTKVIAAADKKTAERAKAKKKQASSEKPPK